MLKKCCDNICDAAPLFFHKKIKKPARHFAGQVKKNIYYLLT